MYHTKDGREACWVTDEGLWMDKELVQKYPDCPALETNVMMRLRTTWYVMVEETGWVSLKVCVCNDLNICLLYTLILSPGNTNFTLNKPQRLIQASLNVNSLIRERHPLAGSHCDSSLLKMLASLLDVSTTLPVCRRTPAEVTGVHNCLTSSADTNPCATASASQPGEGGKPSVCQQVPVITEAAASSTAHGNLLPLCKDEFSSASGFSAPESWLSGTNTPRVSLQGQRQQEGWSLCPLTDVCLPPDTSWTKQTETYCGK